MSGLVFYLHDGPDAFRLQLAGSLSRDTAGEVEQARQTAASVIGQRSLIVDLTGLTEVDATGSKLLEEWHALGARLTVISREALARIRSLTGVPITLHVGQPQGSKWLPSRTAALWLAALLLLLWLAPAIVTSRQVSAEMLAFARLSDGCWSDPD